MIDLLKVLWRPIAIALVYFLICPAYLFAAHGVSVDGKLKYPADFKRFAYTSADAREGGKLILHDLGSFDKMNPFTLKGTPPAGLSSLVFETLAVSSLDEPFTKYGLIAKDITLAQDRLSVTFTLDPEARFSDGSKISASDVEFSLNTMKSDMVHPFYQTYFQDILNAEILDPEKIRFHFIRPNRELHLISCELPVFSKSFYDKHPFADPSLTPPVGSGPYMVKEVSPGKSIIFEKNPNYWATNHAK